MGSSLRNHWMLEELGVEYEEVALDMRAGEHKKEDFLKLNPSGQVPVLVEDDFVLAESMAINNYLCERFGKELLGSDARQRADAWKWSIWSYLNIQKHLGMITFQTMWATEKDQSAIDKATVEVKPFLEILEKHLAGKNYILGNDFSVADVNTGVAIMYGVYVNFDFSAYPNIQKWIGHLSARSAYIKATKK